MKVRNLLRFIPFLAVANQLAVKQQGYSRKATDKYKFGGCRGRNLQAIYIPQRKKLKGYQKQTSTFNKRRRAA